jgi:ribonucleoside-diphosphate reductase alpha chain
MISVTQDQDKQPKLVVKRYFTTDNFDIDNLVDHVTKKKIIWIKKDAKISNEKGEIVFEQKGIEVPGIWSDSALNIVASRYFRGTIGEPSRESSVKTLIQRVVNAITEFGIKERYFASVDDSDVFRDELTYLCANQMMAFNSPVWFNVGVEEKPQASACFINSVEDTLESILDLAKTEGMLFKWGSGAGSNLSTIRSNKETLQGGCTASGPVSFMKGYDAFAGVIKSGGKTRRAAKMVILNADHPDILEFVDSKSKEEKKAWALIDAGYNGGFNVPDGAYDSVFYQNANHSVRVKDEFMKAFLKGEKYQTRAVVDGRVVEELSAVDVMDKIAEAAHLCGDPGMQYDTTINDWHTCKETDRINSSNPCSEYMFLDDSACNLASLNLMKFNLVDDPNNIGFDINSFERAVDLTILAQEILVNNASYPTPAIEKNSHDYRPLGLGYANLGALLMSKAMPYDSIEGRTYAGLITAVMCGGAYRMSAIIAASKGFFQGYNNDVVDNSSSMLNVIRMHRNAATEIQLDACTKSELNFDEFKERATNVWQQALRLGTTHGYRNSQVTVLAPTGTIGFMMDCDTTGVEPDIALVKYKKLVGGGYIKIVNQTTQMALEKLGYNQQEINDITVYIQDNDTIEGAPHVKLDHMPVFDCAFKPAKGTRSITPMGHILMMSAVQPFLSGAISKTVNMPADSTVEDIKEIFKKAWLLKLKAVAIYRDGCKRTQPLSTSLDSESKAETATLQEVMQINTKTERRKLPDERPSITHKFSIGGHEGYVTVGLYEDGSPGELFIIMSKQGSMVSGLMDVFATSISLGLQHGVPLESMIEKFSHTSFAPSGFTINPDIRIAKSIPDYIFRWLEHKFLNKDVDNNKSEATERINFGTVTKKTHVDVIESVVDNGASMQSDAPPCTDCGSLMVRSGSCYKCYNCGGTSGCS